MSDTAAPSYDQTRTQTFDTDGGQTVVITDEDGSGNLQDQTTTVVSGNGLSITSDIATTGSGIVDRSLTDVTTIQADGSRVETIQESNVGNVGTGPGIVYQRTITTSADGLDVTTAIDDNGNNVYETTENAVRSTDGSLTDTITYTDDATGDAAMAMASDGTTSAAVVKSTNADGLVQTTTIGDIDSTKTALAGSNGSYAWTQVSTDEGQSPEGRVLASASHSVDLNGVDIWTSNYVAPDGSSATKTIQIDTTSEHTAVGEANGIYQTVLGRQMTDAETESLIQYVDGDVLDRTALSDQLLASNYPAGSASVLIPQFYENAFGREPAASDLATYMNALSSGSLTIGGVAVFVAEKAVDEQAGNGLLQLLPGGPQAQASTVTLIPQDTAALVNGAESYGAFIAGIGTPSGKLTAAQIAQFTTLTQSSPASSPPPMLDFASAAASSSGGTLPGLFGGPSEAAATAPSGSGGGGHDPLIINLAGGAVETTDVATSTVDFDFTGGGAVSKAAWTTADEGFLVLDPNDAEITDGRPLIPSFASLASSDTNHDGSLTAAEANAAGLRIWVDANADGVGQTSELETLSQAGVASINLASVQTGAYDNGNVSAATSSFTFANGATGSIADAWLIYGNALTAGADYQFGDNVVTRAADGTASELLYGSEETVDAGAAGLSKIVDLGSGNSLLGGDAPTVTLVGAQNDALIGGSGNDTLLAMADDMYVQTGTGSNAVYVKGDGTGIDATLGTSIISLAGNGDDVSNATSTTSIDITAGTGSSVTGTGSTITIEAGTTVEVSGSGDAITMAGGASLTLDASDSTLRASRAATITVSGTDDTITLTSGSLTIASGGSVVVDGNDDVLSQAGGSTATIYGVSESVDVTGSGAATSLSNGDIVLEDGASDTLTGTGDQIVQTSNSTLTLAGSGASLIVVGTGDHSLLSDSSVAIQGGNFWQVTGSRDAITVGPSSSSGGIVGSDDYVTVSGTGGTVSLDGIGDDVTMNGDTLQLDDDAAATLTGSGDTATLGNRATLAVSGDSDTVVEAGTGAALTITGAGAMATANGDNDTMTLTGSSFGAIAHGANDIVNVVGTSGNIYVDGSHDAVMFQGTGATISAKNSSSVMLADGSGATVDGNFNTVAIGSNTTVILKGTGDRPDGFGAKRHDRLGELGRNRFGEFRHRKHREGHRRVGVRQQRRGECKQWGRCTRSERKPGRDRDRRNRKQPHHLGIGRHHNREWIEQCDPARGGEHDGDGRGGVGRASSEREPVSLRRLGVQCRDHVVVIAPHRTW